ncbi:MAG: dienelactone hydrolase family protein [Acidimicrobiales bacterium]
MTQIEKIIAPDGGTFDGDVVLPEGSSGPGILLLQEIFGVGAYIRAVADRLAALGYVVMMPDAFWRVERRVALPHDEAGLGKAFEYAGTFAARFDEGIDDLGAALNHLRGMREVRHGAGVMGFCLGGRLAWSVASRFDPDVAVSYYGSGIADALGELDAITCPTLLHYGTADPYIPRDQIDRIAAAVEGKPGFEVMLHEGAGHAFDNHEAAMFHQAEPAAAAWKATVAFLGQHLPATR